MQSLKISNKDRDGVLLKFGKKLAEIRTEKGVTQEDLAFDVGVDRTYISYIERGKRNPSLYLLWRIAKRLKTDIKSLVDL